MSENAFIKTFFSPRFSFIENFPPSRFHHLNLKAITKATGKKAGNRKAEAHPRICCGALHGTSVCVHFLPQFMEVDSGDISLGSCLDKL